MSTSITTLAEAESVFGVQVDEHHNREADIPVLTGLQFQGDVAVIPNAKTAPATVEVPTKGIAVVKGESGGNTHLLLADGACFYNPSPTAGDSPDDLDLGTLTVFQGATAYLAHPEHAFAGIGAGTYTLRRQREQADVARFVED